MDGTTKLSSQEIYGKLIRDFGIDDTGIELDVIQWVGDCLAEIGTKAVLSPTSVTREVKSGRVLMPCGLDLLVGVEYNNCMLDRVDNIIKRDDIDYELKDRYYTDYPYIKIDLKDGETLKIHYRTYPCDDKGFPFIPNLASVRKAVEWYLVYMLLQRNFKHPVINYEFAHNKYEYELKDIATNDLLMQSPDEANRTGESWLNPFHDFNIKEPYGKDKNYQ